MRGWTKSKTVFSLVALVGFTAYLFREPSVAVAQRAFEDIAVSSTLIASYVWKSAGGDRPAVAPPGRLWVEYDATTVPELSIYDHVGAAWNEVPTADTAESITGAWSFDGNVDLGDNEDDLITVNAPVTFEVWREDFDSPIVRTLGLTSGTFVMDEADTEENILVLGTLPIYWRVEAAAGTFGGTYAPETFLNGGVFSIDDATILDNIDNEANEYAVGGHPTEAIAFDEDSTETAYCEISVTIADISDISAEDFYFGFFLAAAVDDAFGYTGANTMAYFQMTDTAGDLDIETELNGGGTLNDDSGTTWADAATHVLRVEISADAVAFAVDGTAVTQTNAVLDADAGDLFVCRFGIRSAGTSIAGVDVNYIEIGRAQ